MAWPPNPNKSSDQIDSIHDIKGAQLQTNDTKVWQLLEKTMMASIEDRKIARRWSIFFKLLTFAYLAFVLMAMLYACSSSPSSKMPLGASTPHIAVVDVKGGIGMRNGADAPTVSDALTDAFESEQSKAVVLNIDSPGGSPVQSDEIWQTAMDLREAHPDKKLYAIIGDIGASGAYYIAASADEIWVNPSSLVGSIGVIMSGYNAAELLDKIGLKDRTMTAGEHKDLLSISRDMTPEEQAHVQALLNATHQNFIDAVKKGRGNRLKDTDKNQIFSGLIWSGKQAVALGLADKTGGINQLKRELDLDTVDYSYNDPMARLFDRFGVQVGKGIGESIQLKLEDNLSLK